MCYIGFLLCAHVLIKDCNDSVISPWGLLNWNRTILFYQIKPKEIDYKIEHKHYWAFKSIHEFCLTLDYISNLKSLWRLPWLLSKLSLKTTSFYDQMDAWISTFVCSFIPTILCENGYWIEHVSRLFNPCWWISRSTWNIMGAYARWKPSILDNLVFTNKK